MDTPTSYRTMFGDDLLAGLDLVGRGDGMAKLESNVGVGYQRF
ncbi:hypothetical protein FTV88_2873 [Heliorestis convoluta]|uniref:Uncharacterized protein n=1 Tax=Heliorestis convoluta TaxID=356322 RepID=A0A5Q2N6G3_9FIRM|nr:hypothetical protein FTV88_2873 [Heliorestis convoluta]